MTTSAQTPSSEAEGHEILFILKGSHGLEEGGVYTTQSPYGADTVGYAYDDGWHAIVAVLNGLTRRDIELARRLPLSLGLYSDADIVLLTYRIPGLMDGDIQYSVHLAPPWHRSLPQPTETRLTLGLVQAESGRILVVRNGVVTPDFAAEVSRALGVQSDVPWDEVSYRRRLAELYDRCPSTADLEALCSARCELQATGGEAGDRQSA